jgi:hypothetical protein
MKTKLTLLLITTNGVPVFTLQFNFGFNSCIEGNESNAA